MAVSRSIVHQCLAGFTGSLSVMMVGSCLGWVTPVIVGLLGADSKVPMTSFESSWMVACIEVGAILTPLPIGILVDRWGRKWCLLGTALPVIISWLLVIFTKSIGVLILVRLLQGFSLGAVFGVLPMYLAEIADPKIRGALSAIFRGMFSVGTLYEYVIGPYVSYDNLAYFSLAIPVVFFVTFIWMPETPYFYLVHKDESKATKSLLWLRGADSVSSIETELKLMKDSVDEEMKDKASWLDVLATPVNRKLLLCVQVVSLVVLMSGMSAIQSFASLTFASTSSSFLTPDQFTILLGTLVLCVTFLSAAVVDSMGRRPLLLISTIGGGISEILAGLYFYLDEKTDIDVSEYSWVAFVTVVSYIVLMSIGGSPLMTTLQAELFPSNTRGVAGGITGITQSIVNFISLFMYQNVANIAGMYLNFWIFASFSFAGAIFVYFYLLETKGRTFAEIQSEYSKDKKLKGSGLVI